MNTHDPVTIRSYRRVFHVSRRLYRIERWTIPIPGGLPLLGIAYFAIVLILVLVAGQLPLLSVLVGLVPPPVRYVIVPAAIAAIAANVEPDGRTPHRYLTARIAYTLRASITRPSGAACRPTLQKQRTRLALLHDSRAPRLARAWIVGPCEVVFSELVRLRPARAALHRAMRIRTLGASTRRAGELITDRVALGAGERLEIRP